MKDENGQYEETTRKYKETFSRLWEKSFVKSIKRIDKKLKGASKRCVDCIRVQADGNYESWDEGTGGDTPEYCEIPYSVKNSLLYSLNNYYITQGFTCHIKGDVLKISFVVDTKEDEERRKNEEKGKERVIKSIAVDGGIFSKRSQDYNKEDDCSARLILDSCQLWYTLEGIVMILGASDEFVFFKNVLSKKEKSSKFSFELYLQPAIPCYIDVEKECKVSIDVWESWEPRLIRHMTGKEMRDIREMYEPWRGR